VARCDPPICIFGGELARCGELARVGEPARSDTSACSFVDELLGELLRRVAPVSSCGGEATRRDEPLATGWWPEASWKVLYRDALACSLVLEYGAGSRDALLSRGVQAASLHGAAACAFGRETACFTMAPGTLGGMGDEATCVALIAMCAGAGVLVPCTITRGAGT